MKNFKKQNKNSVEHKHNINILPVKNCIFTFQILLPYFSPSRHVIFNKISNVILIKVLMYVYNCYDYLLFLEPHTIDLKALLVGSIFVIQIGQD